MIRIEYTKIVARHGYRTDQPWDLGGIRIMQLDGVNGDAGALHTVKDLERGLALDWAFQQGDKTDAPGAWGRYMDNHYGYTVESEGAHPGDPDITYQLRFSDGSLYVWLMPNGSLLNWPSSRITTVGAVDDGKVTVDPAGMSDHESGFAFAEAQVRARQLLEKNIERDEDPTELLVEQLTNTIEELLVGIDHSFKVKP